MRKDDLDKNLHRIVRRDPLTNEINGAVGLSLDNFDKEMKSLLAQLNIDTATWALAVYEKELGLKSDISKPLDERRSVIKSKLRGTGKVGAAQIKIVADAYSNGDVEVNLENGISIEFTSLYGIPSNLDDLKRAVREIAPAHLSINYTFKYVLYSDIKEKTYNDLVTVTYGEILNGGIN